MELGVLVQHFRADLSNLERGYDRAEARGQAYKRTFNQVVDDITGNATSKFGASGRYVNDFVNEIVTGSSRSAQAAQKMRGDLKSLEDQAEKIRNRFKDFNESLRISFGGKVDGDFLRQFRSASTEAEKLSLLTTKFGKDAANAFTPVEKAAFSFSKLERDGGAALTAIQGKAKTLTSELSVVEQAAGGAFGAIGGAAGVATAAVAAAVLAVVGFEAGVYKIAMATAAYAGGIKDLSQQTGIGADVLSTLNVAAITSGTSIENAGTSLSKYLQIVSRANNGNEKAAKLLSQVGFSSDDVTRAFQSEDAAAQILIQRIGSLSNNEERLDALKKVGIRNQKEFNGLITEINESYGGYVALQEKAKSLGVFVTPEQAEAADKFGDSVTLLELKLKGFIYTLGHKVVPEVEQSIDDISDALGSNRNSWDDWGEYIADTVAGARAHLVGLAKWISTGSITAGLIATEGEIAKYANRSTNFLDGGPRTPEQQAALDRQIRRWGGKTGGGLGDDEDKTGESAARKASRRALQIAEVELQATQRIYREESEEQRRRYQQNLVELGEYSRQRIASLEKLYQAEQAVFQKERAEIGGSKLEDGEKSVRLRQLKEKEDAARSEYERQVGTDPKNGRTGLIQEEEARRRIEIERAHAEAELRLKRESNAALDGLDRAAAEQGLRTYSEYEAAKYQRALGALRAQAEIKEKERELMANDPAIRQAINDEIKAINEEEKRLQTQNIFDMAAARVADLESAQRYGQRLHELSADVVSTNQQTLEIQLRALEGNTLRREELILHTAELAKGREAERSRAALAALGEQKALLQEEIRAIRQTVDERAKLKQLTVKDNEEAIQGEKERLKLITEIEKAIVAEKQRSAAEQADIERRRQEAELEKWKEISRDIGGTLADAIDAGIENGAGAGLKSLAQSALKTIRDIERELLESVIYKILTGNTQGSDAGGITGAISNWLIKKILGDDKNNQLDTSATRPRIVGSKDDAQSISQTVKDSSEESTQRIADTVMRGSDDVVMAVDRSAQELSNKLSQLAEEICQCSQPQSQDQGGSWWKELIVAGASAAASIFLGPEFGQIAGQVTGVLIGGNGGGESTSVVIRDPDTGEILDGGGGGATRPRVVGGHANGGRFGPNEIGPINELGPELIEFDNQLMFYTGNTSGNVIPNSQLGGPQINLAQGAIQVHIHNQQPNSPQGNGVLPQQNRARIAGMLTDAVMEELERRGVR